MQRITLVDRQVIEYYLKLGWTYKNIGEKIGRDHTVVSREVKRNSGDYTPYRAETAHYYAQRRERKKHTRKLEKPENKEILAYVLKRLEKRDSPEQIAGRLHKLKLPSVCHETIYDYIYNGQGYYDGLAQYLRRRKMRRRKRFKRKKRQNVIPERISISFRPEEADRRERLGDWETDLVLFGGQKEVLSSLYERRSLFCRLRKQKDKSAKEFEAGLQESMESVPERTRHTITRDNGSENVKHKETEEIFGIPSFFCDPYSSWQKGGVENLNGLVRDYFPKKCDFAKVTEEEIQQVEDDLNNRPRKKLDYLTPNEFIAQNLKDTEDVH